MTSADQTQEEGAAGDGFAREQPPSQELGHETAGREADAPDSPAADAGVAAGTGVSAFAGQTQENGAAGDGSVREVSSSPEFGQQTGGKEADATAGTAAALAGEHHVATADAMHELGLALGAQLTAGDILVLTGPLGAGKTTLTRGIGEGLGVRGPVQSPTFVLARTHPSLVGGAPLVHVDAYRLGSAAELDDLGIDFASSVVVVEWGRGMVDALADTWWDVEIERPVAASDDLDADELDADAPRIVRITPAAYTGTPR